MAYNILTYDVPQWEGVPKAYINSYVWGGEYIPVSYGQIILIRGKGFAVRLTSFENETKAVYTNYNDPVYKDSCLEFFVSFNNATPLYMNFETNSNGAFLAAVRTERKSKTPIDRIIDINEIKIKGVREGDGWYVEYLLSFAVIEKLFGVGADIFQPGYCFKGNFYKCGDETAVPHYGSYYPINLPSPDFHCPEFFGGFIIV
ncbi:MAG: carbohydrate-binding family 9-like protein [Eubacteriales bacterium]|nr:carbohydrate-binding family 9-like protein [Eubacteriales bacterium]